LVHETFLGWDGDRLSSSKKKFSGLVISILLMIIVAITVSLHPDILLPSIDDSTHNDYGRISSPAFQGNQNYSGTVDPLPSQSPKPVWSTKVGSVIAPATVSDGRVFVGTIESDILAMNSSDGSILWRRSLGLPIVSSPAISEGKVFVGTFRTWKTADYNAISEGLRDHSSNSFFAIDGENGEIVWNFSVKGNVFSSPTVYEGILYFGAHDGNVYALEAETGRLAWKTQTDGAVWSSPALSEGVLFIGSDDQHLYAMDAKTGEVRWK
jgi:outer membrane protein assembly factor BamB